MGKSFPSVLMGPGWSPPMKQETLKTSNSGLKSMASVTRMEAPTPWFTCCVSHPLPESVLYPPSGRCDLDRNPSRRGDGSKTRPGLPPNPGQTIRSGSRGSWNPDSENHRRPVSLIKLDSSEKRFKESWMIILKLMSCFSNENGS